MHLSRRVVAPQLFALAAALAFAGNVKDDAYIAFRYAAQCARGHGLTFNAGDPPVEGFTSFLWTLALVLPARLGLPLLVVAKVVGVAAFVGMVALVGRWVALRGGDATAQSLGRWLVATNGSLIVWSQSGMEPVVTAFVTLAAMVRLDERRAWAAMLLAAAAALLRPECHLVLIGVAAVVLARRQTAPALVVLALVALVHYGRWRYFGSLWPNTALVKLGRLDWTAGLGSLGDLGVTNLGGVTVALALVQAARRRDAVALVCAALLAAFLAYLVRVGRDEMFLVRLYLPVWPLALGLAAPLLASAWRWRPWGRVLPAAVLIAGVVSAASRSYAMGHLALGWRSHGVLAERIKARARPGDLVVFQDLGLTPYQAMELRFVDPIGLVDATVGRIRAAAGASPFGPPAAARVDAAIRDHLFALRPRLVALVAYVPDGMAAETRRQFDAGADRERLFGYFLDANPYHVGLHADGRFAGYRLVDVVRRKDNYWLVLYERAAP